MKIDLNFISQNIAPKGVKKIIVCDMNGNKVGDIPLGHLTPQPPTNKLYTFGALSDVHLPYDTGSSDFIKALDYFNDVEKVDFICISGDMGSDGTDAEWANFKSHVDTHSPNTPVHISAGNHDAGTGAAKTYEYPVQYTGNPLYYSFNQGDDVFIMFGMSKWGDPPFSKAALQWLYETLEVNRNKRCFVFQHMMRKNYAGDASGRYGWDGLNNTNGKVFLSLMEHYKNVIWFHGHSHCEFEHQQTLSLANSNYDRMFGCHSVHIPSCCATRNEANGYDYEDSEGYVVDVYENGIHLRGRDFVAEKFLPIASYWIDATMKEIEEKTYVDSLGVIDTGNEPEEPPVGDIIVVDNSTINLNYRFSSSAGGLVALDGLICINIDVEPNTTYKLSYSGSITDIRSNYDTLYLLNAEGTTSAVNGNSNLHNMTQGVVFNDDNTGAEVTFTTYDDTTNMWFSVLFKTAGEYIVSAEELANVVCTLEIIENNITLPAGTTYDINVRDSFSGKNTKTENGMVRYYIPCNPDTPYKLNVKNLPIDVSSSTPTGNTGSLFCWDTNKTNVSVVQEIESSTILQMINLGHLGEIGTDNKSFFMNFTTSTNASYITLSLVISTTGAITEEDIKDIIINLENISTGITLPEGTEVLLNQRYSKSGGGIIAGDGNVCFIIPVEHLVGTFTLRLENMPGHLVSSSGSTLYKLDPAKTVVGSTTDGVTHFYTMPSWMLTVNEDSSLVEVTCTPEAGMSHLALTYTADLLLNPITEDALKGINITLVGQESNGYITLPEGSELVLNQRYSSSGGGLVDELGAFAAFIPIENDGVSKFTLNFSNLKRPITAGTASTMYLLDSNKERPTDVNNSANFANMTFGVIESSDRTSAQVTFIPPSPSKYIVLSVTVYDVSDNVTITESDIANYVIDIDDVPLPEGPTTPAEITSSVTWAENTRLSSSSGGYSTLTGAYATNDILCEMHDVIRFYGARTWANGYNYICAYDSTGGYLGLVDMAANHSRVNAYLSAGRDDNNVLTIVITNDVVKYIRVCNAGGLTPSNMRVFINKDME